MVFRPRAADSVIEKPGLARLGRIVNVAQVDEDLAAKQAGDAVEVEGAELVPLGNDHQHVGAVRRAIGIGRERDPWQHLLRLVTGDRIKRAYLGAALDERVHERDRRRFAHVVGVRLEREAEHADPLAGHAAAERVGDPLDHLLLAIVVDLDRRPHDPLGDPDRVGRLEERERVLGKAAPAVAGPSVQELRADAVVEADAARDVLDVGVDRLAQVGDLAGKRIGVLGLAFKPNTDDMREAPSIPLIAGLLERGAEVIAFDPVAREQAEKVITGITYADEAQAVAEGADALVVVTEWDEFRALDLEALSATMRGKVLVDLRNVYDPEDARRAGLTYSGIGRGRLDPGA